MFASQIFLTLTIFVTTIFKLVTNKVYYYLQSGPGRR